MKRRSAIAVMIVAATFAATRVLAAAPYPLHTVRLLCWSSAGSPLDVTIRRTNLVVANAVDLGEHRLPGLVERVGRDLGSHQLRQRLFTTIWENVHHVGELGSLVQTRC